MDKQIVRCYGKGNKERIVPMGKTACKYLKIYMEEYRSLFLKGYICDNLFFCLNCKKVYNQNQIKLYCRECNKTYLTTRRSIKDQQYEYFYSVSYMNYHCFLENEEKIRCLNCGDDLYYNITKIPTEKEQNGIRDIYCINCKLIFDTKQIFFNCKICGENFKCTPQIYRNFS